MEFQRFASLARAEVKSVAPKFLADAVTLCVLTVKLALMHTKAPVSDFIFILTSPEHVCTTL
jgi:hypothetical protein